MRRLKSSDDLVGIRNQPLRETLCLRLNQCAQEIHAGLAEFWLVEPGDRIDTLEAITALPIAHGWFSETRYPEPDFAPGWEVLEAHPGGYEMGFVTSDAGQVTVLWIPRVGTDPVLLALCADFAP